MTLLDLLADSVDRFERRANDLRRIGMGGASKAFDDLAVDLRVARDRFRAELERAAFNGAATTGAIRKVLERINGGPLLATADDKPDPKR